MIFCLVFTAPAKWRVELRAKIGHYRNRCFRYKKYSNSIANVTVVVVFFILRGLYLFSSMLIFSCRYFKRKFVPISIKFLIPQTKIKTAIERFTSHLLTENLVNIYIIQYGENKKIPFLKRIKLY